MAFSQLQISCDAGGNASPVNVVIGLPPSVAADAAGQVAAISALAETISRVGFWDSATQNFYPAASIRKITPA